MKVIKYKLCTIINHGTKEEPNIEELLSPVEMGYNEINEEIAKAEAYNGEYAIEEAEEEPIVETLEQRTAALEEAINLLLEGATE